MTARVNARKLIRALHKLGFVESPERGTSHLAFSHPDGRRVTVARHGSRDIKKGTLAGILRDLNISPDELRELL
ncbi:type II toxin-antitoxin system HicA family toxin [Candidatus Kaiserbacteria bacterium]|nr:type II toxin-antitoxin system HicA family toxin [Candidatus Kaiserbacteria bacterium]